jgi:hypothetical protein
MRLRSGGRTCRPGAGKLTVSVFAFAFFAFFAVVSISGYQFQLEPLAD